MSRILLTILLVGFAGATLVRLGPGFDVDERLFDNRLSENSRQAIQAERAAANNIGQYYFQYISNALHGDLGTSLSLHQPVSELIGRRLSITAISIAYGVLGGGLVGFGLAVLGLIWQSPVLTAPVSAFSGLCLSIPSAALALLFFQLGQSGRWALALVVFPPVYRYSRNVLSNVYRSPHVMAAFARGLERHRVVLRHIILPAAAELAAVAAVSVTLSFGASIPVEVMCDLPGVGQLAWQAAQGRDLPLLVGITLLIAAITISVNGLSDLLLEARPQS